MVEPKRALLYLTFVFAITLVLAMVWPKDGLHVSDSFALKFPQLKTLDPRPDLKKKERGKQVNDLIASYLEGLKNRDSVNAKNPDEDPLFNQAALKLQYARTGKHPLEPFFRKLSDIKTFESPVRVMHFGDSQIEGDRMSGYIRQFLQKRFGGSGPGLLPIIEAVPSLAIAQSSAGKWTRYALFGGPKPNIGHFHFGPLQNFARFEPGLDGNHASLFYAPNPKSASCNKRYSAARLFLGNVKSDCTVEFLAWDTLLKQVIIPGGTEYKTVSLAFDSVPDPLEIRFHSNDSPDVYALSLESHSGILVDNIGMRGSSGTDFTRMGRSHLTSALDPFNIGLVILQYGGNTVPHIQSPAEAAQYGKWFGAQIKLIQEVVPDCGVVVIGPSDMSTSIDGEMQTFPFLENVRDAMKAETIKAGAAYWDLFEIMGGNNSMPSWVNADPPLAASDHIHFTLAGARTTADLFVTFLLEEFDQYQRNEATQ